VKTYFDIVGDGGSEIVQQVTDQANRLKKRLSSVKVTLAIASGKGGVGKSSLAAQIASIFAYRGRTVGILDADLNGPSIPKILGVRSGSIQQSKEGIIPAKGPLGLRLMSLDLFIADHAAPVRWKAPVESDSYMWRGVMESTVLRQMLADTMWGELDYLIIDVAPGTDRIATLSEIMPSLTGMVLVTIPSEVSQRVVLKSIMEAARGKRLAIAGLVENMRGYACTHCQHIGDLFMGDSRALAASTNIPYLGGIPFDPVFSRACDRGIPLISFAPDSISVKEIWKIVDKLERKFSIKNQGLSSHQTAVVSG